MGVVFGTLWLVRLFQGGIFETPMCLAATGFLILTLAQLTQPLAQLQVLNIPALAYNMLITCFAGAIFASVLLAAYSWQEIGKR